MTIRSLAARGLSFAHLAGLSSRAARAEDDEDKKRDNESDDDYAKRMEEKDKKEEEARKAEEEDKKKEEARKAEEEEKKKEEARARGEQDDSDPDAEDDDEEMRGKSAEARARLRERARCAAIFASQAAGRNPVLAANLAFASKMTRAEAIATLEGTPAPASAAHVSRAARNPDIGIGGGAKPSPQQALAARWDQNLKAANPGRR